jgi:hypothetical protein
VDRLAGALRDVPLALTLVDGYIRQSTGGSTALGFIKSFAAPGRPAADITLSITDVVRRSVAEVTRQSPVAMQLLLCLACLGAEQGDIPIALLHQTWFHLTDPQGDAIAAKSPASPTGSVASHSRQASSASFLPPAAGLLGATFGGGGTAGGRATALDYKGKLALREATLLLARFGLIALTPAGGARVGDSECDDEVVSMAALVAHTVLRCGPGQSHGVAVDRGDDSNLSVAARIACLRSCVRAIKAAYPVEAWELHPCRQALHDLALPTMALTQHAVWLADTQSDSDGHARNARPRALDAHTPLTWNGASGPQFAWVDDWIAILETTTSYWKIYAMTNSMHQTVDWMQDVCRVTARVGPGYECFAVTLMCLGSLFYLHGNHADAQPLFEQALDHRQKRLGLNHRLVAQSLHELSTLLWKRGHKAAAKANALRSYDIRQSVCGPDHPDVAQVTTFPSPSPSLSPSPSASLDLATHPCAGGCDLCKFIN